MSNAAIVVLVSVIVVDLVIIGRAVGRIRLGRVLRAKPLRVRDARREVHVATGFRWLEPHDDAPSAPILGRGPNG